MDRVLISTRGAPAASSLADFFAFHVSDEGDQRIHRVACALETRFKLAEQNQSMIALVMAEGSIEGKASVFGDTHFAKSFVAAAVAKKIQDYATELVEKAGKTNPDLFCQLITEFCQDEILWVDSITGRDVYRDIIFSAKRDDQERNYQSSSS